jgi:23S rRNA (adenine2030-N6)-methyltransferase
MNYRHVFHAGNFADVFKHLVLTLTLQALHRKEAAFRYIETHAGAGRYDLESEAAERSGEYRDGIARLWGWRDPPPAVAAYLDAVRAMNPNGRLRWYPGSPQLARRFLRPQDRMSLCERQPEEAARLARAFAGDRQVTVQQGDGYRMLAGWLPPRERRGVVLIDPPYESPAEFERVQEALAAACRRWATGCYLVWYPIKTRAGIARFHEALRASGLRKILVAECLLYPDDTAFRLNGCGIVAVNPVWQLDEQLREVLPGLAERLRLTPASRAELRWLVPE